MHEYASCQEERFPLCDAREVFVALECRKRRIASLSSLFCSVLDFAAHPLVTLTGYIFSASICAHLNLGRMSSCPELRVCVSSCRVSFSSVLVVDMKDTDRSCFTVNPRPSCPRSVGEVFFYPFLQLIICLAYATVIISPASVKPMSFLF